MVEYLAGNRIIGTASEMNPTFQDDFSSDKWVDMDSSKIGVNTTLERLDFDIKRDGSNDGSA